MILLAIILAGALPIPQLEVNPRVVLSDGGDLVTNCFDYSAGRPLTSNECYGVPAPESITWTCNVDTSEPSQLEVFWTTNLTIPYLEPIVVTNTLSSMNWFVVHTNQYSEWHPILVNPVNGVATFSLPNNGQNLFLICRSTGFGTFSAWY